MLVLNFCIRIKQIGDGHYFVNLAVVFKLLLVSVNYYGRSHLFKIPFGLAFVQGDQTMLGNLSSSVQGKDIPDRSHL